MLRLISKKSKILVLFFFFFSFSICRCFAFSVESVDAVVRSSICGNSIAEGGEECDVDDLNKKNCLDLGFLGGGILTCDSSCHFNSSGCINKIISTPTSIPIEVPNNTQNNASNNTQNKPFNFFISKIISPKINYNQAPSILNFFGFDKYQKFGKDEIFNIVKKWIDEQKKEKGTCDINNDNKCDARDFSILLYYMKK